MAIAEVSEKKADPKKFQVNWKCNCFNSLSELHIASNGLHSVNFCRAVASRIRQILRSDTRSLIYVVVTDIFTELDDSMVECQYKGHEGRIFFEAILGQQRYAVVFDRTELVGDTWMENFDRRLIFEVFGGT